VELTFLLACGSIPTAPTVSLTIRTSQFSNPVWKIRYNPRVSPDN